MASCNGSLLFGAGERRETKWLLVFALVCLALGRIAPAADFLAPKSVLVLHSFSSRHDLGAFYDLKHGLRTVIPWWMNFHVENLEDRRFGDQVYEKNLAENDLSAWLSQRLPTYCVSDGYCLSHEGIGGDGVDGYWQISFVAHQVKRVLFVERPENIPIVHDLERQIRLDWRQLRRWNISESALPPGILIPYREPTMWERGRKYIIAAIALIVAQALLIARLLWQRAQKRKAEIILRESEKRFRVMADATPSLIWMCDSKGRITYLNERRLTFTGPDLEAEYGDGWGEYIHPDDRNKLLDTISNSLKTQQPFSEEYRLRRSDGVYRWMFDVASPRVNGDGSFAGLIGSAIDTTDQKLPHQALENVSGQLIEAQERERSRIARDLHDDICQRLALLSMELDQATRSPNGSQKQNLEEIRKHCSEIAGDVQSLSHQLHSSKLDYLGIVAAIRGFCMEFSIQHEVRIEFTNENVPSRLSKDISLCLFRVAQEALHNAVKYSGVRDFAVQLNGTANEVRLVVKDEGAGFDVEEASRNRGLGLLSMQERVHLVRGRFSVESQPGKGTRIIAVVPQVVENGGSSGDAESRETASATEVI
jgi:PAS domain S-box-containing protein